MKRIIITYILLASALYCQDTYTMKKGDNLYRISKKFNIDISTLMGINNISNVKDIAIGSVLIVTEEVSNTYLVKKGDTLFSIAKKSNMSVESILEINNLSSDFTIYPGQLLTLNQVTEDPEPIEEPTEPSPEPDYLPTPEPSIYYEWPVLGTMKEYNGRIKGIEITGIPGDYIRAVSSGEVIWYDSYKGIGKVVLISGDNGYDYIYGTKESLDVKLGTRIDSGTKIGRLTSENNSIIFSIFKEGKPLDNITSAPR